MTRRTLDALVFDMDGTLLDSTAAVTAAYRAAVLAGGGPPLSPEEVVAAYHVGPPRAMLSHLLGRPCRDEDLTAYHTRLGELAGDVTVYPGVRQALGDLRRRGVPLAVFTGASREAAGIILDGVGLMGAFSVLVGGDQVERPKPAPDGVTRACELLGVTAARAGYVGDSPLDLEAARRSGALAVASAWGHLYTAAAPADVVVSRPGELLSLFAS